MSGGEKQERSCKICLSVDGISSDQEHSYSKVLSLKPAG